MKKHFYQVQEYDREWKRWECPSHLDWGTQLTELDDALQEVKEMREQNKQDQVTGYRYRIVQYTYKTKIVYPMKGTVCPRN